MASKSDYDYLQELAKQINEAYELFDLSLRKDSSIFPPNGIDESGKRIKIDYYRYAINNRFKKTLEKFLREQGQSLLQLDELLTNNSTVSNSSS